MKEITKALLEEATKEVLNEYVSSQLSGTDSPDISVAAEQIPSIRKSKEKEAGETGLQPEDGFNRSGFGISSNAFAGALKDVVKKELAKMLKQKEKKA